MSRLRSDRHRPLYRRTSFRVRSSRVEPLAKRKSCQLDGKRTFGLLFLGRWHSLREGGGDESKWKENASNFPLRVTVNNEISAFTLLQCKIMPRGS